MLPREAAHLLGQAVESRLAAQLRAVALSGADAPRGLAPWIVLVVLLVLFFLCGYGSSLIEVFVYRLLALLLLPERCGVPEREGEIQET